MTPDARWKALRRRMREAIDDFTRKSRGEQGVGYYIARKWDTEFWLEEMDRLSRQRPRKGKK
jgi:hypothetical protein